MKRTIYINLLLVVIFIKATAQVFIKDTINEKNISGTTYIIHRFESSSFVDIENKNRCISELMKQNKKQCIGDFSNDINVGFVQLQKTTVKNAIPKDKIAKLTSDNSNKNLALRYVCNKSGEIKAVAFFHIDTSLITLEEIKLIEEQLLKLKVNIINSECPETEYFYFISHIRYKDLLDE